MKEYIICSCVQYGTPDPECEDCFGSGEIEVGEYLVYENDLNLYETDVSSLHDDF